jgi:hypothetical protein
VLQAEGEEVRWDDEVKGRERLFVLRYCTDSETFLNGGATYKKVYEKRDANGKVIKKLSRETCNTNASRLLKKERVRTACARLLRETQADVDEKSQYRLLHDMLLYATYNPADIIDEHGELRGRDLKKLGELAKCVTEIIPSRYGYRVKLADRGQYINQLLQYLKIVRPEIVVDEQLKVVEMVRKCVDVSEWNKFAEESEANK